MSMQFRDATSRARQLLAPKRPLDKSESALTADPLRDNIVDEAIARSARFKSAMHKAPEIHYEREAESSEVHQWGTFGHAMRDLARGLFGWDEPEVRRRQDMRPSFLLNRDVIASTLARPEWEEQRPYTRNMTADALVTAMAMGDVLKESAQGRLAEHIARAEEMDEVEREAQDADEMLERLRNRARQQHDAGERVDDDTRRGIKKALKSIDQTSAALQALMNAHKASNVAEAVQATAAEMAQAGADAAEMMSVLPGFADGEATNLPLDQQMALAEKFAAMPGMRDVAKMLGRFIRDMMFTRQARTKNVNVTPVGITTGRDLGLMLPHELARAYHPVLQPLWMRDFANHALLQYQMEGDAPAGKGPVILVHDGSGSMAGEKFVWATALALAILKLASSEHREFAGVEFGSARELKTWLFPAKCAPDPEQVVDYATHFFCGGTSTVAGMREALRICKEHPEFSTADVVLIGDGCDTFGKADEQVREELRKLGVRIHGLSILTPVNAYFEQMCEWHMDVQDLAGPNDATRQLAESIT